MADAGRGFFGNMFQDNSTILFFIIVFLLIFCCGGLGNTYDNTPC